MPAHSATAASSVKASAAAARLGVGGEDRVEGEALRRLRRLQASRGTVAVTRPSHPTCFSVLGDRQGRHHRIGGVERGDHAVDQAGRRRRGGRRHG